jgi:RimJ/RimL family protein N-acetyltransferase
MNESQSPQLTKGRQEQLLKLVAKSFYKELSNYGVDSSDIVTVSLHLLDYVTQNGKPEKIQSSYYRKEFVIKKINDQWKLKEYLQLDSVRIYPLSPKQVSIISKWLKQESIQLTYIDFLPKEESYLTDYLFEEPDRKYFAIEDDNTFMGIMGAENIDLAHRKLEMKKFVGVKNYSGKGIGKRASFLFLYYAFMIMGFNKVYIHTIDTNIRNINLNSKLGFELEGIFFQEIQKSGKFMDVVRMGLLKNRWLRIYDI